MEIISAIDIRHGRCVRLYQGDYGKETVYAEDPVAVARGWQEAGTPRLHVVDLDGAREGWPVNADLVSRIVQAVTIPVQVGGGVRDRQAIEGYLETAVDRVILGTAAVKDRDLLAQALDRHGQRIVVSVDAKVGVVAIEGWREETSVAAVELIANLTELGVRRFIYTDVLRDGTLKGPNFAAAEEVVNAVSVPIIYAGGISSIDHLVRLARVGVEGAIVGQALYTGEVDLRKAQEALSEAGVPGKRHPL
jgi:phosphoribosylformimino-5-aminoimidazole carboxamide ribotide isomerase